MEVEAGDGGAGRGGAGRGEKITRPRPEAALAPLTVDAAAVTAGFAQADAVEAALVAKQKEAGEAQHATRTRDDAEAELRGFWKDFARVAKIALEDQPQQREILGLRER